MSLQEIFDAIVTFVDNLLGVLFSYDWSWLGDGEWEGGFLPFVLFFWM
jgi:hypothetical protein